MNKNIIIWALALMFFTSCESVVDGLNENPNKFTDTSLKLVLNAATLNVATIVESDAARLTTIFNDQFTGVDRQYGTFNRYGMGSPDFNRHWSSIYYKGITQAQIAKKKAKELGSPRKEGQAQILEAFYFGEAALLFGDIPFSEVNDVDNFPDPKFESQASVLESVVTMLKDGAVKADGLSASNDVFSTNSTWTMIGYALAARYELALKKYDAALASAQKAGFVDAGRTVSIKHGRSNGSQNLYYQWEVLERTGYLQVDSSYMFRMLDMTSTDYKGNAKTDETARRDYYTAADGVSLNTKTGFAGIATSYPAFSFEEVQLIIAECAARLKQYDAALEALNAVRSNNSSVYKGGSYLAYEMSDFESGGMVNNGSVEESMILEVLKEKYCAVLGLPTYQDIRRTKNLLGVPIKKAGAVSIPQRFIYPASEDASNDNFPGLVDFYEPTPINK